MISSGIFFVDLGMLIQNTFVDSRMSLETKTVRLGTLTNFGRIYQQNLQKATSRWGKSRQKTAVRVTLKSIRHLESRAALPHSRLTQIFPGDGVLQREDVSCDLT